MNVFCLVALSCICRKATGNVFIDMVSEVVKNYATIATITEISCSKRELFSMLKKLASSGYHVNVAISTKSLEYPEQANRHVFVMSLECKNSDRALEIANERKLFAYPLKWIFYKKAETNTSFDKLNILLDSDVTVCTLQKNQTVSIDKIYKRHDRCSIHLESIGYWAPSEGLVEYDIEKNIIRRRSNLMGTTLNTCIVITNNDSLNHLTDRRDKHIDSIAKVNYVLVEHLSDIINATLNYSVKSTWGYFNRVTSEWNGMIGELIRNEADIGGTPLFFTIDRVDIIDYIAMTTPTRSKFVFREPKLSYVTNVFTLPFDTNVWISTICMVVATSIVLIVIFRWEWVKATYLKRKIVPSQHLLDPSVQEAAFFSFSAICQQGITVIPSSVPGRITSIMLFVSCMFLYSSYSANIVALLQSSSTSIQTLDDLLKSRLKVGVDDTVFNRFYFPSATETTRRALYLQKVAQTGKPGNFLHLEEGVRRMREGLFAFHMETGPGYKIVGEIFQESEKCGLQEIQFLQVIDPWLAIQKNSSFKKILKIGLRKIHESGLQMREVGLIYTKKPICTSRGSTFISVGIVDCYPAAVVLVSGIVAAFVVFTLEIILKYHSTFFNLVRKKLIVPYNGDLYSLRRGSNIHTIHQN